MTAQPGPTGAVKEGLVQGGGRGRGCAWLVGGAHLGQGQADGACATAHIQHRAARVQLGPVPDEPVEHLSCSGVHLGAGWAIRATPPPPGSLTAPPPPTPWAP